LTNLNNNLQGKCVLCAFKQIRLLQTQRIYESGKGNALFKNSCLESVYFALERISLFTKKALGSNTIVVFYSNNVTTVLHK